MVVLPVAERLVERRCVVLHRVDAQLTSELRRLLVERLDLTDHDLHLGFPSARGSRENLLPPRLVPIHLAAYLGAASLPAEPPGWLRIALSELLLEVRTDPIASAFLRA